MTTAVQTRDSVREQMPPQQEEDSAPNAPAPAPQPAVSPAQKAQFSTQSATQSASSRGTASAQSGQFSEKDKDAETTPAAKEIPSGYQALVDVETGDGGTWRLAMPMDASYGAQFRPGQQIAEVDFDPGILIIGPEHAPDLSIEHIALDVEEMVIADLQASMPDAESGASAIGQFETQLASEIARTYLMSPMSASPIGTLDPSHDGGLVGSLLDQLAPGWGEASEGKDKKPKRYDLGSVAIEIDQSSVVSAGVDTERDAVYVHLDNVRVFALDDTVEVAGIRVFYHLPDHRFELDISRAEINTRLGDIGVLEDAEVSYSLDEPPSQDKSFWSYLVWGPLATSKYAADQTAALVQRKIRQAARDLVKDVFPPALKARNVAELQSEMLGMAGGGQNPQEALQTVDLTEQKEEEEQAEGDAMFALDERTDEGRVDRQVLYSFDLDESGGFVGHALGGGTLEIAISPGTDLQFARTPKSVRMSASGGEGDNGALFLHHPQHAWMNDFRIQRLEYDHEAGALDIDAQPEFGEYTQKLIGSMMHYYVLPQTVSPATASVHHALGTGTDPALEALAEEMPDAEILAAFEAPNIGQMIVAVDQGQTLAASYEDGGGEQSTGNDIVRISAGTGLHVIAPDADWFPSLTVSELTYDVRTSEVVVSGDEQADIGASAEGLFETVVEALLPMLPGGAALVAEHEDQADIEKRRERQGTVELPSGGTILHQVSLGEMGDVAVVTAPGYNLQIVQDNAGAHVDTGGNLRIFATGFGIQAALHNVQIDSEARIDFDLRSGLYEPDTFDWGAPVQNGAAEAGKHTWGEQVLSGLADKYAGEAIRTYMPKPAEAGSNERVLASVELDGMSVDVVIPKAQPITAGLEGEGENQALVVDAGSGFTWRATGGQAEAVPTARIQRIAVDLASGEVIIDAKPDVGPAVEELATKFLHHMLRQPGMVPPDVQAYVESVGYGAIFQAAEQVDEVPPTRAMTLWEGSVPQAGSVDVSIDGIDGMGLTVSGPLVTVDAPGQGVLARIPDLGYAFELRGLVYNLHDQRLVSFDSSPPLGAFEQSIITAASRQFMPELLKAQLGSAPALGGGAEEVYVVKPGDTLGAIARRYNVEGGYRALARHNAIADPNRIAVGQEIRIPGSGPTVPAQSGGASAVGEKDGRFVHFTYDSQYGPVEICTDPGASVSINVREVPRQSRGGEPAKAIVLESSGGSGIYINSVDPNGELAQFDGDGLHRFVYFLNSGDVEMDLLVDGKPGDVGPMVEGILEASMMTFVAPHVPEEYRKQIGVVTAEEAQDPQRHGDVPRGFIPLGMDVETPEGVGNLRVYVHPNDALNLSHSGARTAISTQHGIYFKIDGFPYVPRFRNIVWNRLEQTVEADGLGDGSNALITKALHGFIDSYLSSQGYDPGVKTLYSSVSGRDSRIEGAFPLYEGNHYGLYLEPGYSLDLEIKADRINFNADGLFVDGAKIARYDLDSFYYDFNTQKAHLDLDSRGVLSWLLKPFVELGIGIKGLIDEGEWGITGTLRDILPAKVKRKGYNLFRDEDLSGTFDQLRAKFQTSPEEEQPEGDEPSVDAAGLLDDMQDFDYKSGRLQPIYDRIERLDGRRNRRTRKRLERLVDAIERFDKGKRVRLKIGRHKYRVESYELRGNDIVFHLEDRDVPVTFVTSTGTFHSRTRTLDAMLKH